MIAFEAESGESDLPALTLWTESHRIGDANVVEEDLVERLPTAHLLDGPDLDTGEIHRDDEGRHAFVLHDVHVAARDEFAVLGELSTRTPDLLTVDDPFIAVALGPARERREVAAGARFREQLATEVAGREEVPDEVGLLLGCAVDVDGRCDETDGHAVGLVTGGGHELCLEFGERACVLAGESETTVLDRPGDGVIAAFGLLARPATRPIEECLFFFVGFGLSFSIISSCDTLLGFNRFSIVVE